MLVCWRVRDHGAECNCPSSPAEACLNQPTPVNTWTYSSTMSAIAFIWDSHYRRKMQPEGVSWNSWQCNPNEHSGAQPYMTLLHETIAQICVWDTQCPQFPSWNALCTQYNIPRVSEFCMLWREAASPCFRVQVQIFRRKDSSVQGDDIVWVFQFDSNNHSLWPWEQGDFTTSVWLAKRGNS